MAVPQPVPGWRMLLCRAACPDSEGIETWPAKYFSGAYWPRAERPAPIVRGLKLRGADLIPLPVLEAERPAPIVRGLKLKITAFSGDFENPIAERPAPIVRGLKPIAFWRLVLADVK